MGNEKISEILKNHETRIAKLEAVLAKDKPQKASTINKKGKKTLSDHILELRDKGFFSRPKTSDEVYKKIEEAYSCVPNRVAVTLIRLFKRRNLRKASKIISDKTYTAYVWS